MTDGTQVSILGTPYTFRMKQVGEDRRLEGSLGCCDATSKEILIIDSVENPPADWETVKKRVARHEIIHAYLFESGLGADAIYHVDGQEHPEMIVDWFARQAPRIFETFQFAGVL